MKVFSCNACIRVKSNKIYGHKTKHFMKKCIIMTLVPTQEKCFTVLYYMDSENRLWMSVRYVIRLWMCFFCCQCGLDMNPMVYGFHNLTYFYSKGGLVLCEAGVTEYNYEFHQHTNLNQLYECRIIVRGSNHLSVLFLTSIVQIKSLYHYKVSFAYISSYPTSHLHILFLPILVRGILSCALIVLGCRML